MRNKSFLSGIFSVVSFVLISTFVISSTFGQCPTDVSGTWVIKYAVMSECCPDPSDNGRSKEKQSIVVAQVGNEISASWVEEDGDSVVLTGVVNGNSVYYKVEGSDFCCPGCGWVEHGVGIINGNRIKGNGTATDTCDTCKGHYKFKVKIVK